MAFVLTILLFGILMFLGIVFVIKLWRAEQGIRTNEELLFFIAKWLAYHEMAEIYDLDKPPSDNDIREHIYEKLEQIGTIPTFFTSKGEPIPRKEPRNETPPG